MTDTANILEIESISKEFPGVKALSDVTFALKRGEVLSIVGENGAGKSTLIKVLCGVHHADSGRVLLNGEEVKFNSPLDALKAGISTIHQELSYLKELSVAENMYVGRLPERGIIKHIDWNKLTQTTVPYLRQVGLNCKPSQIMGKLSVGDKQLAEIAKALSRQARIIIMDEPTSSLGIKETEKLLNIIRDLAKHGISIIYISHKLSEVVSVSDRVICMRDGCKVTELSGDEITTENMVRNMVGRPVVDMYPVFSYGTSKTVFEVRDLCTDYLKNISFHACEGEVLGLFGMAGAGRTETFDAIFGARPKSSGSIFVDGRELHVKTPADAIAGGIAYVTAERKQNGLILVHSVGNNITLATLNRFTSGGVINSAKEHETANEWIRTLDIKTPGSQTPVGGLSGGNQQKVVLSRWLETKPKVLLLNEPTRGVDVGAKSEIYHLIERLCKEGLCIVLIASEMSEVMGISDRILTFADGRITKEIPKSEFSQENLMIASIPGGHDHE